MELIDAKKKADVSLWLYDTDKLREDLQNAEVLKDSAMLDLQNADLSKAAENFLLSGSMKTEAIEALKAKLME